MASVYIILQTNHNLPLLVQKLFTFKVYHVEILLSIFFCKNDKKSIKKLKISQFICAKLQQIDNLLTSCEKLYIIQPINYGGKLWEKRMGKEK